MENLNQVYLGWRQRVLAERDPLIGVWTGELSSSALGTALAVTALIGGDERDDQVVAAGVAWLVANVNADGGWGDTPKSLSNLSTTLIAVATLRTSLNWNIKTKNGNDSVLETVLRAEGWIKARIGSLVPDVVTRALTGIYGKDRTFAVPILTFLAMCSKDPRSWLNVPSLPFIMALLPHGVYRFMRLQVVSYALPALIAVGLCRHVCVARVRGGWAWGHWLARPLLRKLAALQPAHGGFLDAMPLTAFVCLALQHAGYGAHSVVQKGLAFLRQSARSDGSWAIDSNLRTWVTSLAVRAVWGADGKVENKEIYEAERVAAWLIKVQTRTTHVFTGARPGGWAWTDLPGGVPDADDTSGALIALRRLQEIGCMTDMTEAVRRGVRWLLAVQNADGGMPTFCRGWGRLPFDRSCPDISAHALVALGTWSSVSSRVVTAMNRLIKYLARVQEKDGSWAALWFGHQDCKGGKNFVVGTARVVAALRVTWNAWRVGDGQKEVAGILVRGEDWLLMMQKADGGWGMGDTATTEETALAVIALKGGGGRCLEAVQRGHAYLELHMSDDPAPIGLYFSLLWYHEKMYPLVWGLEALTPAPS